MKITTVRQLRTVVFVTLLALALVLPGALTAATAGAGKKRHRPTLLWRTYPLQQRPTASDVTTINQGIVNQPAASRSQKPKSGPDPVIVTALVLTILCSGAIFLASYREPLRAGIGSRRRDAARRSPRRRPRRPARNRPQPAAAASGGQAGQAEDTPDALDPEQLTHDRSLELELTDLVIKMRETAQPDPELERALDSPPERLSARPQTDPERLKEKERKFAQESQLLDPQLAQGEVEAEALSRVPEPRTSAEPEGDHASAKTVRTEHCEIGLGPGFVEKRLYAFRPTDEGSEVFAVSPFFRLRDDEKPTEQGKSALAALVEDLERSGWKVVAEGPGWYDRRLEK
jgi:hypothetical protein